MPFACTILELLRAGRDPSPPKRLVDFAIAENDERTLTVARTRLPVGALDLEPGDRIVAIGGHPVSTPSQVVNRLRGSLGDVTLTIERGSRTMTLRGTWPAEPRLTERTGLRVSGALFAPGEKFTAGFLPAGPALMVHHVDRGSDAQTAELAPYDLLVSANGEPVDSVASLGRIARDAADRDEALSLVLMRLSDTTALFEFHVRELVATDVMEIGPERSGTRVTRGR